MNAVGDAWMPARGARRSVQQLDFALAAFSNGLALLVATGQFGATPPEATLFTMSDFGRTLQENANGGNDHARGNHMVVLGTKVIGNRVYGTYEKMTAELPDSVDGSGRWMPQPPGLRRRRKRSAPHPRSR